MCFSNYDKNISYVASFEVRNIPEILKTEFEEGLNGIKNISVRENRGKEIINKLTNSNDVEVLFDSAMLLLEKNGMR